MGWKSGGRGAHIKQYAPQSKLGSLNDLRLFLAPVPWPAPSIGPY